MDSSLSAQQSTSQKEELSFNGVKYQVEELLGSGLTAAVHKAKISVIDIENQMAPAVIAVKSVGESYRRSSWVKQGV